MTQSLNSLVDTVLLGDTWALVDTLPHGSVQCIVTSPPYFGHRQYAKENDLVTYELGRESEPHEYVTRLVLLFDRLRLVLKDCGTVWLNLGDTYRDGQLLGIPWRVALGMQERGWILRSEIIWNKTNAMPSPVKNRPTTSHEHIFLFAKTQHYYYDADAIREPHITFSEQSKMRGGRNHFGKQNGTPEEGKNKGNSNLHKGRWDQAFHPLGRNKRTVWDIALGKFREAHFAVFPETLVENCILAGSAVGDIILDPFMGSGTTACTAKKLGRHYLGMELVPGYIEMTKKRVANVGYQLNLALKEKAQSCSQDETR